MKKLAIILGMALLLTAGCTSGDDSKNLKASGWSASEIAEFRAGVDSEVGPRYGSEMTDCVVNTVIHHYTPKELYAKSSEELQEIGYDAGYDCAKSTGVTS